MWTLNGMYRCLLLCDIPDIPCHPVVSEVDLAFCLGCSHRPVWTHEQLSAHSASETAQPAVDLAVCVWRERKVRLGDWEGCCPPPTHAVSEGAVNAEVLRVTIIFSKLQSLCYLPTCGLLQTGWDHSNWRLGNFKLVTLSDFNTWQV